MNESASVLVTGSSGRVGKAIAQALRQAGWTIRGLDQRPGPFTTRIGNVADQRSLDETVPGARAVIHTAALHAPHVGTVTGGRFREINVAGTERLLESCVRHGVGRLVYTSTTSVYGQAMVDESAAVWVDEALAPIPRDIYDETKLAAEALCETAFSGDFTTVALRMSRCFPESLREIAIYRLYRGVDVRDVAEAHRLALDAGLPRFRIYNVSARSPFTREDLEGLGRDPAAVIERHHPWAIQAFRERGWEWPRRIDRVYAIDRAETELGYAPAFNFPSLFGR